MQENRHRIGTKVVQYVILMAAQHLSLSKDMKGLGRTKDIALGPRVVWPEGVSYERWSPSATESLLIAPSPLDTPFYVVWEGKELNITEA